MIAESSTPTAGSNRILKLLSLLLQYPDEDLWTRLPEMVDAVADLPDEGHKRELVAILSEVQGSSLLALQEIYTAAFDLAPSATLNLTYHAFGDNEKRAAAMVRLQQAYAAAGFETYGGELPDFLPLMLEFLSICQDARLREIVWAQVGGLEDLAGRLPDEAKIYAALLELLNSVRTGTAASFQDTVHPDRAHSRP